MFETDIIFEKIKKTLCLYNNLDVSFRQIKDVNLFPSYDVIESLQSGVISYEIKYNPRIDYVLKLYNLALFYDMDVSEVLYHYVLFNAYIECNDYSNAEKHLIYFRAAKNEINKFDISVSSEEESCNVFIQKYFMLLHEAVHCLLIKESDNRALYIQDTINYLREVSDFESSLGISNYDIINHSSFQKHIDALIPEEFPEELKIIYGNYMKENFISKHNELYVGNLITNEHFLEEVTCDRLAWTNIITMCKSDITDSNELFEIHNRIIAALYIMGFNESVLHLITPGLREKYIYPSHFINIRHKSIKRLLEFRVLNLNLPTSPYKRLDCRIELIYKGFLRYMAKNNDVEILSKYNSRISKWQENIYSTLNLSMEECISKM